MRSTQKRLRVCMCLLVINLIFIWGNSLMPGAASARLSGWVSGILRNLLNLPSGDPEGGHGLLRKFAHFSEFACLGLLLCWRLGMAGRRGKDLAALTLLGGLAAACVDETIQVFVPGRGSGLIDVWIDTCGAAAGMLIPIFGHHFIRNKHGKNHLEDKIQ